VSAGQVPHLGVQTMWAIAPESPSDVPDVGGAPEGFRTAHP